MSMSQLPQDVKVAKGLKKYWIKVFGKQVTFEFVCGMDIYIWRGEFWTTNY